MHTITTELYDGWSGDPQGMPCTIEYGNKTILIRPAGYGDSSSRNGCGFPVLIEYYDKDVRVIVWADINKDDPTHVISLAGAKESNRSAE